MTSPSFALAPFLLATFASGCLGTNTESFMHPEGGGITRAAFELDCPKEQLHVSDLGGMTMGVSGCGKKAVYKWVSGHGWVNNTASSGPSAKPRPAAR